MANVIIAIDLPYMAYELEQAIARIARLGQTRPCFFYYLTLDTGDKPNINSRNVDISKLNNDAVAEITGFKNQTYLEEEDNVINLNPEAVVTTNFKVSKWSNNSVIETINKQLTALKNFFNK
jgi:hypothetical protein